MSSKAIAILANPRAGSGQSLKKLREARRQLWGRRYEFFVPNGREEFSRVCANLDPNAYDAVVVMGGDGTVNLAIRELARESGNEIPIYPFPAGTANDLASEMKTTPDWEDVENLIHARSIEKIDLVRVNGVPFATVAGIGIGAQLTEELNARRDQSRILKVGLKHLKAPIYSALTLKTILTRDSLEREYTVDSGNLRQKVRASALFVCNQGLLGSNLRVSDNADNSDKRFSVLVATSIKKIALISALAQLQRGKIPAHFLSFSAGHLRIDSPDGQPIRVFGDGEILVNSPRLCFEIFPRALAVFQGRTRGAPS